MNNNVESSETGNSSDKSSPERAEPSSSQHEPKKALGYFDKPWQYFVISLTGIFLPLGAWYLYNHYSKSKLSLWYENKYIVIVQTFCFFPVGWYGLYKSRSLSYGWKIGIGIVVPFIMFALAPTPKKQKLKNEYKQDRSGVIASLREINDAAEAAEKGRDYESAIDTTDQKLSSVVDSFEAVLADSLEKELPEFEEPSQKIKTLERIVRLTKNNRYMDGSKYRLHERRIQVIKARNDQPIEPEKRFDKGESVGQSHGIKDAILENVKQNAAFREGWRVIDIEYVGNKKFEVTVTNSRLNRLNRRRNDVCMEYIYNGVYSPDQPAAWEELSSECR